LILPELPYFIIPAPSRGNPDICRLAGWFVTYKVCISRGTAGIRAYAACKILPI